MAVTPNVQHASVTDVGHIGHHFLVRLILAKTFAKRYFAQYDAPDLRTIRELVRKRVVRGRELGHRVYIDEEAFLNQGGIGTCAPK
jgi:hypothetical protein